jgi:hypothetical protein
MQFTRPIDFYASNQLLRVQSAFTRPISFYASNQLLRVQSTFTHPIEFNLIFFQSTFTRPIISNFCVRSIFMHCIDFLLYWVLNSNFFQNSLKYFLFSIVSDEHILVEISWKQIRRSSMLMAHRILKYVRLATGRKTNV